MISIILLMISFSLLSFVGGAYFEKYLHRQVGRQIRERDEIYVEQYWTNHQGSGVTRRYYTVLNILEMVTPELRSPNKHFVRLIGNEPTDGPSREKFRDELEKDN